jgi:para-aminobenzoate synthetase/4-amino-4-deoxychorismate lyase
MTWRASIRRDQYHRAIATIRDCIARGDVYQVNFTYRQLAELEGEPWGMFTQLCRGQRSGCCGFVDIGDLAICSASPELFFQLEGDRLWSRPMKGTAPRGRTAAEDRRLGEELQRSAKNRSENLMIVDMVRNDLGRVALPGSVRVASLWQLERHPSVFQLTSTVEARTEASLPEIFAALFPCASITGAPKVRAMEIIAELEDRPRGVYTGAIGYLGPGRRARFTVAIRTALLDRRTRKAEYGTGGGIVWDSVAEEEWQECALKSLSLRRPAPQFQLLETLRWEPATGYSLLARHLERLASSADYFGYPCDLRSIRHQLERLGRRLTAGAHRIRLLLADDGSVSLEPSPLPLENSRWRVALAHRGVDSQDPFLFHKTTHRELYERRRRDFPDHDDVLLWNEAGEITESTRANIVLRRGDRLLTPPVDCGLLAGTFRGELLDKGEIVEERIPIERLDEADEILLVNSVRGWIQIGLERVASSPIAGETENSETQRPAPA